MRRVSKPRCARGQNCYHVSQFSHIDKPPTVPREGDLCGRCQEAERDTTFPKAEHEKLFGAARVLLNNGIEDEDEIYPTLVFAANLDKVPRLERVRDGLTKAAKGSKDWAELNAQLYDCFGGLSVVSKRVEEGVPVFREAPFRIIGFRGESEHVEEVAIDVFKRSATPEEISEWYEWILKRENLECELGRGEIAFKYDLSADRVAYKGRSEFLRILARPEQRSVDPDVSVFPITSEVRIFPPPQVVAGNWGILRGSQARDGFAGFGPPPPR